MEFFNTLTRRKERFTPTGESVTMYVCGVTPYDTTHLGHARTYLVFDVLQRYLRFRGMPVRYVQNITDVDEPLFERASQMGVDYRALAQQCVDVLLADFRDLNILMPERFPRVSEEIDQIIALVERLIASGMAYERNGSVYFRATRFPDFGAMSGLDRAGMLAAQRDTGERPEDPNKEDPIDFLLWIAARPGEPTWESPWGRGRPGWHIECSEMASRYLGTPIDIHGGGEDLIFPHHSSEIAQSESLGPGTPFARFWVHVGLVGMDGEKMSKSRGNLAFARDLLPVYGPDAIRYYLLGFPYRDPFSYLESDLAGAAARWERIAAALAGPDAESAEDGAVNLRDRCLAALDDDLDTPTAMSAILDLADHIHASDDPGARAILRSLLATLGFPRAAAPAPATASTESRARY
jgi:L-cysteine:1D-myo-inositol 2-amino-2-deoxy-alpha-D-glucopyranoside ligase